MTPPSPVEDLTCRIDEALLAEEPKVVCKGIKRALEEFTKNAKGLEERLLEPVAESYGRRLLHRDPAGRYTILVMTWGTGQGTPIHDHCGMWCVEGVCKGRIRVLSYRLIEELPDGRVRFAPESEILAGIGEAGALIPPFDYHVIENPFPEPAATVHVYGGEMNECDVFLPVDGGFHCREKKLLQYTPETA